jgi:hypothetical protein
VAATTRKALKIPMTSSIRAPEGEATLMARGEASRWVPTIEATREGPSVAGTQDTRRRRRDNIGLSMIHRYPRATRSRLRRKTYTKKLAMGAISAEAATMRIHLKTTISNKIPILEAAIKSSGD